MSVLDMRRPEVRRMLTASKARGFVSYDELNAVLPAGIVTSRQIEDVMAMLTDMGINVIESDEDITLENFGRIAAALGPLPVPEAANDNRAPGAPREGGPETGN